MICEACGTTLVLRFFPVKEWICPCCGHENDPDDVPYQEQEDKHADIDI